MTLDEWRAAHASGAFGASSMKPSTSSILPASAAPDAVDWRAKGAVTPVGDEGQCGSTWAWSPITAIESNYFIKSGKLIQLSVGQQVDCGSEFGSQYVTSLTFLLTSFGIVINDMM
jgi:C1A family cysteine protease